jgi:hypothetical protein
MCPVCIEERKKHKNHHLVNYKRYVLLFSFIKNNFVGINQSIVGRERRIKEYKKLVLLLEQ